MTGIELQDALYNAGFSAEAVCSTEAEYIRFERSFIQREFARGFEQLKFNLGAGRYIPEINDCDDFSLLAMWYARHLHRRTSRDRRVGVAFGFMNYYALGQGYHSINVALCETGLLFFEPQDCSELKLHPDEIASCSKLYI